MHGHTVTERLIRFWFSERQRSLFTSEHFSQLPILSASACLCLFFIEILKSFQDTPAAQISHYFCATSKDLGVKESCQNKTEWGKKNKDWETSRPRPSLKRGRIIQIRISLIFWIEFVVLWKHTGENSLNSCHFLYWISGQKPCLIHYVHCHTYC